VENLKYFLAIRLFEIIVIYLIFLYSSIFEKYVKQKNISKKISQEQISIFISLIEDWINELPPDKEGSL